MRRDMTDTVYAIGDIHGQLGMLLTALDRIDRDGGGRIVFLGDYVDRGPDSKGVIDLLASGQAEGRDWVCLKGNHDRLFEWFVAPPRPQGDPHLLVGYHWFHPNIGGVETAASYGVAVSERMRQKAVAQDFRAAMPEGHLAFLQGLRLWHGAPGLVFVHAGIRPGVAMEQQDEEDLLWIRQEFLRDTRDHGAVIVHGHTPVMTPERHRNRINLDTGAGYDRVLTAAVFEDGDAFVLGPDGREPFPEL